MLFLIHSKILRYLNTRKREYKFKAVPNKHFLFKYLRDSQHCVQNLAFYSETFCFLLSSKIKLF